VIEQVINLESRAQGLVTETQPLRRRRSEVLDEHVGMLEEPVHHLKGIGMRQVEGDALLGSVQPDEVARHSPDGLVVGPREIASARPLHLDDACTQVG
jgi:hypothetical protein